MTKSALRILIADDHAVVREGLRRILSDEHDNVQFGEAGNAQEALDQIWAESWDLVLLDISMPGRSGLEVLKDIKHTNPKLPVLVLSVHPEDQFAVRVLRAGAAGYITKDNAAGELARAVEKVRTGGKYVSPSLAEKLVTNLESDGQKLPHEKLSDREYQVFRLIASGKTVKEISNRLSLSVKTISTHRTRILGKMSMKTNAELMRYAMNNHLVE